MAMIFEDLRVLQSAESLADAVWSDVIRWNVFARDSFGGQTVRAVDSVGANIAEAFGRFHYGEKLQFLYYARGSVFETKYWLNRAKARAVLSEEQVQTHAVQLTTIVRQLNAFAANIKRQRASRTESSTVLRESAPEYYVFTEDTAAAIFSDEEILWIETFHNPFPKPAPANPQ